MVKGSAGEARRTHSRDRADCARQCVRRAPPAGAGTGSSRAGGDAACFTQNAHGS